MAHNTFSRLVNSDNDLEGLVAYSLYKQEKIAWVAHRTTVLGREPTTQEIEDQFVAMVRDANIQQWRTNALQILNQFADNMLASELEKEREAIKENALIKSFNPPWYKRLLGDTLANLASGFVVTVLIALLWVVSSAPQNFIAGIINKALHGQMPQAEASTASPDS
ncbi:hypothetical protein NH8B_0965 [Pseudogulbenkiania sp. NH8B]|uniref:hypothetical protein n=1 Tax=Pseudogulbenkiania sp. (strain NH8B) TaxID=748280 RepID=UPI0002279A83|nr:hypothetical protein [Pseudogulbenkiania sp. NH8B]BAK75797.1 hypothetical protein NH8B_0965 [Pseudogulbenkiania sp. NH8B]